MLKIMTKMALNTTKNEDNDDDDDDDQMSEFKMWPIMFSLHATQNSYSNSDIDGLGQDCSNSIANAPSHRYNHYNKCGFGMHFLNPYTETEMSYWWNFCFCVRKLYLCEIITNEIY